MKENPQSEIPNPQSDVSPHTPQDAFLAALKEVIGALLADSPDGITLSAKDIAEKMQRPEGFTEKRLQIEVGKAINKYKLGVYIGRPRDQRLYKFSKPPLNPMAVTPEPPLNPMAVTPEPPLNPMAVTPTAIESSDKNDQSVSEDGRFNLAESLEQILERKQKQVPDLIERATTDNYEDVVKAITLVEDKVKREDYLKQLSKKLGLPRKLFKDQVREFLQESGVKVNDYKQGEDEGFVDEYNERFAVLLGNNAGVINLKHDDMVIYNVSEFVNLITANETSLVCNERGTLRETAKGSLWLKHPRRKEYKGIEFLPKGSTEGFYNLWKGFPVKPKKDAGRFDCFRELVDDLICNGIADEQKFVWNWLAALMQSPEKKQGTAIAIRGSKGCGKTVFGEVLHMLLGRYYILADKEEHVSGRFNSHLARCLLLHCDEAFFTGNQRSAGTVKTIITSNKHTIEYKGKEPLCLDNYTRVLITSEKERICSADEQERRYAVFEISTKRQNDIGFFRQLFDELQAGGIQALMAHLLSMKVEERLGIPHNEALEKQQIQNLDSVQAYLVYLCSEAILPDLERYWNTKNQANEERITIVEWKDLEPTIVRKDALYQHFTAVTPKSHYIPQAVQFFAKIAFILKNDIKTTRPRVRDRKYCYRFPPREYLQAKLSEQFGIHIEDVEVDMATPDVSG